MSTRSSASRWIRATRSPPARDHASIGTRAGERRKASAAGRTYPQFTPSRTGMAIERQPHRWSSPSLRREMELLVFGRGGGRVLGFPTSEGRVAAMQGPLARGWTKMIWVDSVDGESWHNKPIPPAERAKRHMQYDQYLLTEVLPFTARLNSNPFLITTGASLGAYHAVNFAFRYPPQA